MFHMFQLGMMRLYWSILGIGLVFSTMVKAQRYDRVNIYAVSRDRYSLGIGVSCIDEVRARPDYVFVIRHPYFIQDLLSYLNKKFNDTTATYVRDRDISLTTLVIDFVERDEVGLSFIIVDNRLLCHVPFRYSNSNLCIYITNRDVKCEIINEMPFMVIVDPASYKYYECCR